MKKYNILLFDLDGVILDFDAAEQLSFRESFRKIGIEADEALLSDYQTINHKCWSDFEKGLITKEECTTGRFVQLFEKRGIAEDPSAFSEVYLKGLSQGFFLMPEAREVLEALWKDYCLYVVTNGVSDTAYTRLDGTDTRKYFSDIFVSEELGTQKPDPAYFEKVFARIPAFEKETALLIGDTLSSDIQGAENAGIDCCWVNLKNRKNDTALCPTYEIRNLSELLAVLGRRG